MDQRTALLLYLVLPLKNRVEPHGFTREMRMRVGFVKRGAFRGGIFLSLRGIEPAPLETLIKQHSLRFPAHVALAVAELVLMSRIRKTALAIRIPYSI